MPDSNNGKRIIGQRTWETKKLIEVLDKAVIGETVRYEDLSAAAKCNVQKLGRSALESARYILLREKHKVFGVERNVGLRRLDDREKVETGASFVEHVHRTVKKGLRVITAVDDYTALPNDAKVKHNAYASIFGVLGYVTAIPQVKQIEGKVEKAGEKLGLMKTLEAFRE